MVPISRRTFLAGTTAASLFSLVPRRVLGGPGHVSPSEKTTLAGIGVGGQGLQNMAALQRWTKSRSWRSAT